MNCYEPPLDTNIYGVTPKRIVSGNEIISSAVNSVAGYENTYGAEQINVAIDTNGWGINRTGEPLAWCSGAICYTDYSGVDEARSNGWTSEVISGAVGTWQWHVEFEAGPPFKATVTLTITSHIYSGLGFPTTLKWYTDEYYKVGETRNGWMTCYLGDEHITHDLVKWFGNAIPCKVYLQKAGLNWIFDGVRWNHGYGNIIHNVDWIPYDGAPLITYRTDSAVEYYYCAQLPSPPPAPCSWYPHSIGGHRGLSGGQMNTGMSMAVRYLGFRDGEAPLSVGGSRIGGTTPPPTADSVSTGTASWAFGPDLEWFNNFPFIASGTYTYTGIGAFVGRYKYVEWEYQLDSLDFTTDHLP